MEGQNKVYFLSETRVIDIIRSAESEGGTVRSEHGYLISRINGSDTLLDTYPDTSLTVH